MGKSEGKLADDILRSCVHCGFCNATCPTYQLLGDELDGPRGRIYLIKQVFEGQTVGRRTLEHLDRCLTCRSCETTCPSGVRYGELLELGRAEVSRKVRRPLGDRVVRWLLRAILPHPHRVRVVFRCLPLLRRLLPGRLRERLPKSPSIIQPVLAWPEPRHRRRMLVLDGCVQDALRADINVTAARLLDRLGISLIRFPGCCGAVSQHMDDPEQARTTMVRNMEAWERASDQGFEAIVTTASACSLMLKEYQRLQGGSPDNGDRVARWTAAVRDISEVFAAEDISPLRTGNELPVVAFHAPCTLQHGLRQHGVVEGILENLGFELLPVADAHLCCGAAGTYSLLQPELSRQLLDNKLRALNHSGPEVIATANIGCLLHLGDHSEHPVRHWLELIEMSLREAGVK